MATYSSEEIRLNAPAERVFDKLSNPENLRTLLDNVPAEAIPEDKRAALEGIELSSDSITIPGGPVGQVKLQLTGSDRPTFIQFEGVGTPVPVSLSMHISPAGSEACDAKVDFNLEIPAMLKPMVNGPLKKMTSQIADVLRRIPF